MRQRNFDPVPLANIRFSPGYLILVVVVSFFGFVPNSIFSHLVANTNCKPDQNGYKAKINVLYKN